MKKFLLLFFLFAAMYLIPLGGRPMVVPDEFRYGQIPWEMLEFGNFAAPQMFGHPYFEKPVLGHWLTAANLYLFGYNAFAVRLSSALLTGLTACFVGLLIFISLKDKRLAALGSMMYLGCGMVYALGIFSVLDAPVTMFSTAALFCAFAYLQKERPVPVRIALLILCGIFCGLGFMTKGAPAWVAPALGTAGFIIWQKRWKEFLIMPPLPLLFCVLTILPWAWAAHQADGDFWRYFIEVEHIQRFTESGKGQHPKPWWFLLPFFAGGVFPAAFLLVSGWGNVRKILKQMLGVPVYRFAACCTFLPLLFFSCSSGKLPTYILPCFSGAAVLMAGFCATALRSCDKSEKYLDRLFLGCGWFFAVAGILAVPAGYLMKFYFISDYRVGALAPAILAVGACSAASGTLLLWSQKKKLTDRLYFFALLFALPALVVPFFISSEINGDKMPEDEMREMISQCNIVPGQVHVVTSSSLMHAGGWCFRTRDVQTLRSPGEMKYAARRAVAEKRRPLVLDNAGFNALLKSRDRKDVVYIYRTKKKPEKTRGITHANEYHGKELSARYYPVAGKVSGEK